MGRGCHDFGLLCGNFSLSCRSTHPSKFHVFIGFHLFLSGSQPTDIKIASANSDGLLAQAEMGGENGLGGLLVEGTFVLVSGLFYLIVDTGGKIVRTVFHSNTGKDERTEGEKKTIDAVGKLLEGATPTDEKGKPLSRGDQKRRERNKKPGQIENYDKPGGEEGQQEDVDQVVEDTGGTPKITYERQGKKQALGFLTGKVI